MHMNPTAERIDVFAIARRALRSCLPIAVVLALPACEPKDPFEGVNLILDVDGAPVVVQASVQVTPGQVTSFTTTVGAGGQVKSVQEIDEIAVEPSYFAFNSASSGIRTASADGAAASGNINVVMKIGTVHFGALLTVQDNVVTNVAPRQLLNLSNFAAWKQAVLDIVAAMPEAQRPDVSQFQSMTANQVQAALSAEVGKQSFPFTVHVHTSNPALLGTLRIEQFDVGGRFVF